MLDMLMNFAEHSYLFSMFCYQSGLYFENFGKGSPMENYLESVAKV